MTFRRRQRWLRRLAFGFAFATALFAGKVSFASAVVDEGVGLSPAYAAQQVPSGDELAIRNAIASHNSQPTRPDDRASRFTTVQQSSASDVGVRPDDRTNRFSPTDVAPRPTTSSGGWDIQWDEAVPVGIGALVLLLALGLGLGYLRRPRIAL